MHSIVERRPSHLGVSLPASMYFYNDHIVGWNLKAGERKEEKLMGFYESWTTVADSTSLWLHSNISGNISYHNRAPETNCWSDPEDSAAHSQVSSCTTSFFN